VRVTVRQRGGFAGTDIELAQVDTATLDAATRTALETEIRSVLSAPAAPDAQVGADLMQYELTVDDGGKRQVRTWIEDGTDAAAPIRELVSRITALK
jgi:hypothetical protein